jgi:predicted secreted protein
LNLSSNINNQLVLQANKVNLMTSMAASLGDKGDKFLKLTGVKKLEATANVPAEVTQPDIAKKTEAMWTDLEKQYQQGLHYNLEKKGLS